MKKLAGFCAGLLAVLSVGGSAVVAQDSPMTGPPKVLIIEREWVKPGKGGAAHEKSESAFVNAFTAAKWPTHYFAAESLSGKPRVLFFIGYPSFEAWEKDNHDMQKNATLSAAIGRAVAADGDLLTDYEQSVYTYNPELSLRTEGASIAHSRYFEISVWTVKPGHRAEWMQLVKMYHDGFEKAVPNANWALFESYYGANNGGVYLAISRMTSLAEDDASMGDSKKFSDAMGPEGMKKISELTAACLESTQTNLLEFNPKMSYPGDDWIKQDSFWKPKASSAVTAVAKKPATAPPTP